MIVLNWRKDGPEKFEAFLSHDGWGTMECLNYPPEKKYLFLGGKYLWANLL